MYYFKILQGDTYAPIIEQSQSYKKLAAKVQIFSVGLLLTVAVAAANWSQNFAKTFALN